MKKKLGIITLGIAIIATLSACSSNVKPKETIAPIIGEQTITVAPITTEVPTSSVVSQTIDTLSNNYADFEDMSILINGIKYTFNKSTLQDMIDNNVPFVDISNANNNIKPNYESEWFEVKLDDEGHLAYLMFSNFTEENRSINECPLSSINFDVVENNVLKLSCPFDLTDEQLIINAGEASDVEHKENKIQDPPDEPIVEIYDTYKYTQLSEKYLGDHGYYFMFKDGVLYNYTITYR